MTFAAKETSRAAGEPINLYKFVYGDLDFQVFGYTDAEQPVAVTDVDDVTVTFQPAPVDRTKLTASGSLDKSKVTVTLPQNCDLAALYLSYPPSSVTQLIMYQGHASDPDAEFKVVWTGKVLGCTRKGSKAEFTCEPVSTSMRRNGLRRRYQYGCPLVLYGIGPRQCNANKAAATQATTVASVSKNRITLPAGWNGERAADKFVGGLAEWTTDDGAAEIRTVLRLEDAGLTILVAGDTRGLSPGHAVSVVLGCNHLAGLPDVQIDGDCGPLHDNILNFGGQPWIPLKNPLAFGVNQYYGGDT